MKTQRFQSHYGRRPITVSVECPTRAIRQRLGNTHVGTPAATIEGLIRCQVSAQRGLGKPGWTPEREQEAVRFALWEHEENAAQYRHVMAGHA